MHRPPEALFGANQQYEPRPRPGSPIRARCSGGRKAPQSRRCHRWPPLRHVSSGRRPLKPTLNSGSRTPILHNRSAVGAEPIDLAHWHLHVENSTRPPCHSTQRLDCLHPHRFALLSLDVLLAPTTDWMLFPTHRRRKTSIENGDGVPDLLCRFDIQAAAFQPLDTKGILLFKDLDGAPFEGIDSVKITP